MNMTGEQLRGWIVGTALAAGWLIAETPKEAGAPDLICVRGAQVLAVWAKSANGKTTAGNEEWIAALARTPVTVAVWRPEHIREAFSILTAGAAT
jgi:hypothetical protein